jgi:hypothetical protein
LPFNRLCSALFAIIRLFVGTGLGKAPKTKLQSIKNGNRFALARVGSSRVRDSHYGGGDLRIGKSQGNAAAKPIWVEWGLRRFSAGKARCVSVLSVFWGVFMQSASGGGSGKIGAETGLARIGSHLPASRRTEREMSGRCGSNALPAMRWFLAKKDNLTYGLPLIEINESN